MMMRYHILYIESDADEMESLAELLEFEGFQVSTRATVEAARRFLQEQESQIRLMLIDIHAPAQEIAEYRDDDSSLKLAIDPRYAHIPKIAIILDTDDRRNAILKTIPSIFYISYQQDPRRLQNLMAALKAIIDG